MKRIILCILAFGMLAAVACKKTESDPKPAVAAGTYVWEKEGFGGDFTITLREDGTYEYYEGFLSSYIGTGAWTVEDGVLAMREDRELCGNDFVFRFTVQDGALIYRADGSDKFIYTDVQDGDRFLHAE